jgi:hypothetical protein
VPSEPPSFSPITIRGAIDQRIKLKRFADEMGKSEGDVLLSCFDAINQMADQNNPLVPQIVTVLKTLRAAKATFADPPKVIDPFAKLDDPHNRLNEGESKK